MNRLAKCPVCGKEFTAHRATERYCSVICRRYAYRHRDEAPPSQRASSGKTLRSFRCIRCGKQVVVTQGADKRRKFCSPHCERLYWKHSKNVESQPVQHAFRCRNCGSSLKYGTPRTGGRPSAAPIAASNGFPCIETDSIRQEPEHLCDARLLLVMKYT